MKSNPRESIEGEDFPNSEMLDARITSALNEIIQNSWDRILRGRQIAFMIHDYFRVTGAHDTVLDCAALF